MMGLCCSEVFRDDVVFVVNEGDDDDNGDGDDCDGGGGGDDLRLDEGGGMESSSGILFISILPRADIAPFFRFCKEDAEEWFDLSPRDILLFLSKLFDLSPRDTLLLLSELFDLSPRDILLLVFKNGDGFLCVLLAKDSWLLWELVVAVAALVLKTLKISLAVILFVSRIGLLSGKTAHG